MQDVITSCKGLVTQYNPLATAPGALAKADNCVIVRENIVEDRRGYALYGMVGASATAVLSYLTRILIQNGTAVAYDNGSGTFTNYSGTYSPISGYKMRFVEAYSNLYATTSKGVQVFTDVAGTAARLAGAPRSLDGSYALNAAGSGFLTNGNQCAYRYVIQRTDANGNIIPGYPSTRLWVVNTAATSKNVDHTLYLPAEVTVNDVIQVYRTVQVAGTSSDTSADEMALVYQANPTSGQIAAGFMTFTDVATDSLRGPSLYTSPSQQGIAQANDRPYLAADIALFRSNFMFYANTSSKQRQFFTLVGTVNLSGNTIIIAGTTYTFAGSENTATGQVAVSSTGVAATDIDATARSLVRVINRYATNTAVYAYYLSGPTDLPGQIMIEERGIGAAAYTCAVGAAAIQVDFSASGVQPPVSPATSVQWTSSNQVQKNGLYYSKAQQPECVPGQNYFPVGSANEAILRIIPLADVLIIVKEKSVWRLTGLDANSFVVAPVDLTVVCKSADSVASLSNQVFMLCNQGVVSITGSAVQVISRAIEPNIKPLLTFANIGSLATGIAYESERHYFLSVPTISTDTVQNQTYVYNIFTRTWVRWSFGMNAGLVDASTDKLFFTAPGAANVFRERKNFDDTDYADPDAAITITAVDTVNNKVTFTLSSPIPQPGGVISQGGTGLVISSVVNTGAGYSAKLQSTIPSGWAPGAATYFPSVGMDIEWDTWRGPQGNETMMKRIHEFVIMADNTQGRNSASGLNATFRSNLDDIRDFVPMSVIAAGWGQPWGTIPWGGSGDPCLYRTWPTRNKAYCAYLNPGVQHLNAQERLSVAGCGFFYDIASPRVSR